MKMPENNRQTRQRRNPIARAMTRWLRNGLFMTLGAALTLSLSASAEWKVQDREARSRLTEIRDSHRVGNSNSTNEIMKDPGELNMKGYKGAAIGNLDKAEITASGFKSESRCKNPGGKGGQTHQSQYMICQEIVSTELAQYQYSLEMYERTKKRHEDLAKLERERNGLRGYADYGKLQANTNKVLALQTQLQIDHMQDKTYMDAYAARIQYLKTAEAQLADIALNGGGGERSIRDVLMDGAINVGAGVALRQALDAVKTERSRKN